MVSKKTIEVCFRKCYARKEKVVCETTTEGGIKHAVCKITEGGIRYMVCQKTTEGGIRKVIWM